jgi:hypothetical protein
VSLLLVAGCGSGTTGAETAATQTSTRPEETVVEALERICAAGSEPTDLRDVIALVVPELEALEFDGPDGDVVDQVLEVFDAARLALDEGRADVAGGQVEVASAIGRRDGSAERRRLSSRRSSRSRVAVVVAIRGTEADRTSFAGRNRSTATCET